MVNEIAQELRRRMRLRGEQGQLQKLERLMEKVRLVTQFDE